MYYHLPNNSAANLIIFGKKNHLHYINNVCFIRIRSKLSSVLLLRRIFMKQTLCQIQFRSLGHFKEPIALESKISLYSSGLSSLGLHPQINPISTKGGRLCPQNDTGTPGFSDLPTALFLFINSNVCLFLFRLPVALSLVLESMQLLIQPP